MRNFKLIILSTLLMFGLWTGCKKDEMVRLPASYKTVPAYEITDSSARTIAFIISDNGLTISEFGVCYSNTNKTPTVDDSKVIIDQELKNMNALISGLNYTTRYYFRTYIVTTTGVLYGDTASFTTKVRLPKLTTLAVTPDANGRTAGSGGSVLDAGGAPVTVRGICWDTAATPTVTLKTITKDGEGIGDFVSNLTGLHGGTKYYVRSYATNSAGTGYGAQVSFTTPVTVAEVNAASADTVKKTYAYVTGSVSHNGGAAVTASGLVWSLSADPTIESNLGSYSAPTASLLKFGYKIEGLSTNTVYHVRTYATNSQGTTYGADITFRTLSDMLYLVGDGCTANWNAANALPFELVGPAQYILYTHLYASKSIKLLASLGNWAPMWGSDGSGTSASGKLQYRATEASPDPASITTPSSEGDYLILVDLINMTYVVTPTIYALGSATTAQWNAGSAVPFVYYKDYQFELFTHLTGSGMLKTIGNLGSWAPMWGAASGDINSGTLQYRSVDGDADPSVINTVDEGNYHLIFDIKNRTYSTEVAALYMVGEAIPGGWGWSSPTSMTLASDNKFTVVETLTNGKAFRFFTKNSDWGSGRNYPFYLDAGYAIDTKFENAGDGDSNFKFVGTTGVYEITVDAVNKQITVIAASPK